MKIRIGFSTTDKWYSKIIRWFIGAKASHCYIRIHDKFLDTELILHADYCGVIFNRGEEYDNENVIVDEYLIDDDRLDKSMKNNLRHLGKPYSWLNLFGWMWTLTFGRWSSRNVKNPNKNQKKMACVDFALHVLNDSGITHLPIGLFHPENFRQWCEYNCEKFGWTRESRNLLPEMESNVEDQGTLGGH